MSFIKIEKQKSFKKDLFRKRNIVKENFIKLYVIIKR